jgi:hypothetical protein
MRWNLVVEIDDSAEDTLRRQLLVWTDGQAFINKHRGDVVQAFLEVLAQDMALELLRGFSPAAAIRELRGRSRIAGIDGISVVSCSSLSFDGLTVDVFKLSAAGEGRSA